MIINKIHTLLRIHKALKGVSFDRKTLMDFQHLKLLDILQYANRHIPFYRDRFRENNIDIPDDMHADDVEQILRQIPVLQRDQLIGLPINDIISTECAFKGLLSEKTSGSSGKRLFVYTTKKDFLWKNTIRMRSLLLSGYKPYWKRLDCGTYYGRTNNPAGNFMMLRKRVIHATQDICDAVSTIEDFKPHCLTGFPRYLQQVGRQLRKKNRKIKLLITLGEMLDAASREDLQQMFNCPVRNHYGAVELGRLAFEDYTTSEMYLNEDNYYFELNESNELLVTAFNLHAMPLIRYNLRDVVELEEPDDKYPFRRIRSILGRSDDFIVSRSGLMISPYSLGAIISTCSGVKQYQVIQMMRGKIVINIVRNGELDTNSLTESLNNQKLNIDYSVNITDRIKRDPSGKYKAIINKIA